MCKSRLSILAVGIGLAACATRDLEPAIAETEIEGLDDAAGIVISDVQIIVQPDEWPEERVVPERVTPVLVELQNRGSRPLRIEYRLFSLSDNRGKNLAALPPFNVYSTPTEPRVTREGNRFELVYESERFEVAPYYAEIYRGVRAYDRPFVADQRYYAANYPHWQRTGGELPTRAMQLLALPEGVLKPGGRVAGYLYFEKVPAHTDRVQFNYSLLDARDGRIFAVAALPFVVDR
jgi:hypothetical protein